MSTLVAKDAKALRMPKYIKLLFLSQTKGPQLLQVWDQFRTNEISRFSGVPSFTLTTVYALIWFRTNHSKRGQFDLIFCSKPSTSDRASLMSHSTLNSWRLLASDGHSPKLERKIYF